nr:MAG TPA: hypothetical protein [Bacteriophage sp.]
MDIFFLFCDLRVTVTKTSYVCFQFFFSNHTSV